MSNKIKKQFDVVVMNPPYRGQQKEDIKKKRKGKNNSLWDHFVKCSLKLTKIGGCLSSVHPPRWRKPNDDLWGVLRNKQFIYIEIHSKEDGMKTFGNECDQRYDWYVLKNEDNISKTQIKWEDGNVSEIYLKNIEILPNFLFNEINSLIAKKNEEKVDVLHSYSLYFSRPNESGKGKEWMSSVKTYKHINPCVWSIDYKGVPTFHFTSIKKGHFGIPKIIFSSGRVSSANYVIDYNGDYGMTQYSKGIVDKKENLELIYKAMRTKKFKNIMEACSFSTHEIDKDIISLFRKDFWKEFI